MIRLLLFHMQLVRTHHTLLDREKKEYVAKKLLLEMSYLLHYLPRTLTKKNKTIVYASCIFYKCGTYALYVCIY